LITGVASVSDIKLIGRIGAKTLGVFVGLLGGVAAVTFVIAPIIFRLLPANTSRPPLPPGTAEAAQQISASRGRPTFGPWIASLSPATALSAAANDQIVPDIIFARLRRLAIAQSPEPCRDRLVGLFAAFRDAMLTLVRWVIAVAPIGVFALL